MILTAATVTGCGGSGSSDSAEPGVPTRATGGPLLPSDDPSGFGPGDPGGDPGLRRDSVPPSLGGGAVPSRPGGSGAPGATANGASPDRSVTGTFLGGGGTAVTYDPAVVPAGATARVDYGTRSANTVTVRLAVTGMVPRRAYGAHLHVAACTAVPDAAGPHFQHRADPTKPSVNPDYANPRNEVWLDFTADERGTATVTRTQPWTFPDGKEPRSLILHAQTTATAPGKAGTAGDRVACLTLPG